MPGAVAPAESDNPAKKFTTRAAINAVTYPLKADSRAPLIHAPSTFLKRPSFRGSRRLHGVSSHQRLFGLEVRPAELTWRGWMPGEEYTKTVTIKNTQMKTQKIRYKVPSTPLFSTLFPKVIVLSAGTSFTLPITFKPLKKVHYEDRLEFKTAQGIITIPLKALLPETSLVMPDQLHFGFVAAHDSCEVAFKLENKSSELMTSFSWDVPDPYSIFPPTGSIPPLGSCTLKATFRPMSATVFDTNAVCCFGEDHQLKKVKLVGVGKFPYLVVKANDSDELTAENKGTPTLDFGGIQIHETAVKSMVLQNLSNVRVPFKIQLVSFAPDTDRVFTCSVKEGVVPPMSKVKVPIRFRPTVICESCIDYFEVCPIGLEAKSTIKCQGYCKGPVVSLIQSLMDFGLTYSGKEVIRTLNICNESTCDAVFQVMLDPDSSLWHVNELCGVLRPGESKTLHLSFTPFHPITYYRRLVIMVHNQGPLFVDIIGTCHDPDHHPPQLKPSHVENYKIHAARGLTFYPPQVISKLMKEDKIKIDDKGFLSMQDNEETAIQLSLQKPLDEYFDDAHNLEISHNPPHVSLNQQDVWMGQVEYDSSHSKLHHVSVRLTNHTRGKVTAMWMKDSNGVFEVIPATCDIPPMKVSDFRVIFRPSAPNQFFGAELECYTCYKSMRDFKLVDHLTTIPPWCLTMSISGHTFADRSNSFIPQVELSSNRLTFSATCDSEPSYRTILMRNHGTTPLLYQFLQAAQSGENSFTIKPRYGMSKSKFHISVCRLQPMKIEFYELLVTLRLNDNEALDKTLGLVGTGEQAELLLANSGDMYFQPTCIGTICTNTIAVQNTGRLSVEYMWKIPVDAEGKIKVEQKQGVILPNEIQHHKWTFAPTTPDKYLFKPTCYAWPHRQGSEAASGNITFRKKRKFVLRIIGEGHTGDLKCEQPSVDFGSIICDTVSAQSLILRNTSNCDLIYKLSIEQKIKCPYDELNDENAPMYLSLNKTTERVPARSRTAVVAIAKPLRRASLNWTIFYEIINEKGENVEPYNKVAICDLLAEAVYPSLTVIDAQTFGSGSSISKTQLWRWFNLDSFNFALDSDPDTPELMYSVSTRRSTTRRPTIHTRSIMEFNFGAAPVDSDTCYVSLMLKNNGAVVSEWSFLYPKDLQIPMDYWSETGIFDADELHEAHIQDNKLFTVSPKRGYLQPGETVAVLLQYKHDITGTHRLPVLFKVENGREILLNMVGVTVEPGRRYIHFPGSKHTFSPVAVGGPAPPKQLYEVYNGGSVSVMYEVNLSPLIELQKENYDHSILTCLNPRGEVLPGTCSNIEFIFSPLEAKTYMVDVPIHIVGGDVALIAFSGIGYDARKIGANTPSIQNSGFSGVPKSRSIQVVGQEVFLSEEGINFGNVPLFSRNRSIFFVSNSSEDKVMRFSWHAASETVNDVLRIEPVHGRLMPGEHVLTKVTFCATGQPSFYDLDLICEILDESKVEEYQAELHSWEVERERQEVEFAIYEEDLLNQIETPYPSGHSSPRKMHLENVLNKSLTPMKLSEPEAPSQKSDIRNYQTLPPIRLEDPLQLPSNRSRCVRKNMKGDDDTKWPQPLPPEPFVLHLGISACTHDISEFRTNYPERGETNFIDRMLQLTRAIPSRAASRPQSLMLKDDEEKEAMTFTLSKIIRGVLEDTTFHSLIRSIADEKTPYFKQLPCEQSEASEEFQDGANDDKTDTIEEMPADSVNDDETDEVDIGMEIKRSPFFGSLLEDVLSSTISNIMTEAFKGEVVLTARPRLVALPPSSTKSEENKSRKEKRPSSNTSSKTSNSSKEMSRKNHSRHGSTRSENASEASTNK